MLPYFLGRFGRALTLANRAKEALVALDEALELSVATGEAFYDAELHRLRADALAEAGGTDAAITLHLDRAHAVASSQRASAFEASASRSRASRRERLERAAAMYGQPS